MHSVKAKGFGGWIPVDGSADGGGRQKGKKGIGRRKVKLTDVLGRSERSGRGVIKVGIKFCTVS